VTLAIHQAHEETPPIVDKGNEPRRDLAALEILGFKSVLPIWAVLAL
jgi:hypothetical protein